MAIAFASVLAAVSQIDRSWAPADDGMLAQIADRIRAGQVPFVHFDDPYSGLLGYVHAASMTAFGESLVSMRYPLLVVAALCWWIIFLIGRRWAMAWEAAAVASGSVLFGILLYPTPMPTWYTLATSLGAIYCWIRWRESTHRRWLILAGLSVGIGFLFKITAVYILGAMSLWMGAQVQRTNRGLTAALLCGPVVLVSALVTTRPTTAAFGYFVLPVVFAAALAFVSWRAGVGAESGKSILGSLALTLGMVGIPITAWLAWYSAMGEFESLLNGWIVNPASRLDLVASGAPPYRFVLVAASVMGVLVLVVRLRHETVLAGVLFIAPIGGMLISSRTTYNFVILFVAYVPILLALCGVVLSVRSRIDSNLALVVASACFFGLVGFPYFADTYVLYTLPITVLALFGLAAAFSPYGSRVIALGMVGVAVLGVSLAATNRGDVDGPPRELPTIELATDRSGLRVYATDRYYDRILQLIAKHAGEGPIYAGPDLPEVYFLADRQNPFRALYEVLSPDVNYESLERDITAAGGKLIVLNLDPSRRFSALPDATVLASLRQTFAHVEYVHGMEVRWR